ncbi:hypothetical protein GGX14DRAFT_600970 [Mycena pura]|uniref:Uncharacterized protein n=1 Tax=Mycena pura TaxID=153505 RepID=A0AAD6Y0P6_9AGAR|nr:hypothetical protein GGX14DRAFT_600970 [Mycena pura]
MSFFVHEVPTKLTKRPYKRIPTDLVIPGREPGAVYTLIMNCISRHLAAPPRHPLADAPGRARVSASRASQFDPHRMATFGDIFVSAWSGHRGSVRKGPLERKFPHFLAGAALRGRTICDSLLLLVIIYTRYYPDQPFCPWLLLTDFVEHFFGLARMMLLNFTYAEFLKIVQHVMVRQRILLSSSFKERRERKAGLGYVLDFDATPLTAEQGVKPGLVMSNCPRRLTILSMDDSGGAIAAQLAALGARSFTGGMLVSVTDFNIYDLHGKYVLKKKIGPHGPTNHPAPLPAFTDRHPLAAEDLKLAYVSIADTEMNSLVELAIQEASLICTQLLHIPASMPTVDKHLNLTPLGVPPPKAKKADSDDSDVDSDSRRVEMAAHDAARYSALCDDHEAAVEEAAALAASGPPPPPVSAPQLFATPAVPTGWTAVACGGSATSCDGGVMA